MAGNIFTNPFYGATGSGGTGTGWEGEVNAYADLPVATAWPGQVFLVKTSTGFLWAQRRGLYRSDGATWTRISNIVLQARDDEMTFVDDADNTKKLTFELSNITTGNTRVLTLADRDYDLDKPIVSQINMKPGEADEGKLTWNDTDLTLNIDTGIGPVLQVGQEEFFMVYNDYGTTLVNGTVVHPPVPPAFTGTVPHAERSIANTSDGCSGTIGLITADILPGETGFATVRGYVRNVDTSGLSVGQVWVSETNLGELTDVRPSFPNYTISVGAVLVSDASNGVVIVALTGAVRDTVTNAWNGAFRESVKMTVDSNGSVITAYIEPGNGQDDMTMMFHDGLELLDTNPPIEVTLTAGTANIPQENFVYIPQSTKTVTVSTSDWPTGEHIKIGTVAVRTAAITMTDGALKNHHWNDHIQSDDNQGHLLHMSEKLRQFEAQWSTGAEGSVYIDTTPTPDGVYAKNTAGVIYQLHRQAFPQFDMTPYTIDALSQGSQTFTISDDGDLSSVFPDAREIRINNSTGNDGRYTIASTLWSSPDFIITVEEAIPDATADGAIGDDIHVVNDFVSPYETTIDLSTETADSLGNTLTNRSFSFVIWGVANKAGRTSHLMLNKPTGSYARLSPSQAVSDANNYSVYDIPKIFQGVGFLIARFTFQLTADGNTWTLYDTEDLRGRIPNATAGGGGGGGGVTTYLGLNDTPSAYTNLGGAWGKVNSAATAMEFNLFHNLNATTELTIASGIITATQSNHTVDTQSDDATDDLDTISGGTDGDTLTIRPEDAARNIVLKHGTGNLRLPNSRDVTLISVNDIVTLIYDGTNWDYPAQDLSIIISDLDTTATGAELTQLTDGSDTTLHDHDGISENTSARHAQSHNIASHSDTSATGAQLDTLTDDSIADALHRHSELVASDGDPDPALSADADGKVSLISGTGINEFSIDETLAGDSDDAVPTEQAVKAYADVARYALGTSSELTIATGVITVTGGYHTVDTESDDASDDLATINGGVDGNLLVIRPADATRTIVVKHATGNIELPGGNDISLYEADDLLQLFYDGSNWQVVPQNMVSLIQANEFLFNQNIEPSTLAISTGTVAFNFTNNGTSTLTLTENATFNAPTGLVAGMVCRARVVQNGTGNYTCSFNVAYDFAGEDSSVNLGANQTTLYQFETDGTNVYAWKIWEDD